MAQFYKNIIWIYLCALGCFAYSSMLSAIPDHVYIKEGEELALDHKLPVSLAVNDGTEVMAMADSTYETLQMRRSTECKSLAAGEHEVVCYLFGILPVKEVEVSVVEGEELYAAGRVVGIYGATQGVLVLASSPVETAEGDRVEPAKNLVFSGDYIVAVNDVQVKEKEDLIRLIDEFGDSPLVLSLWRGEELIDVSVRAVQTDASGKDYMLGLWVKDDMAGIGTLTYYDAAGSFGALGHGIGDGETGELLRIREGELYESEVLGITKGSRGSPGELQGVVYYGKENQIGAVTDNTDIGIYGRLDADRYSLYSGMDSCYPVGYKQDVQLKDAVILSDVSGEPCTYHIQIDSLDYSPTDRNKGIRFHVDDEALLELTGGIVQGLSGSPIIQNGRLIGAVTHVLVNEPTQGYGIFIESMLEK
ncbi:MAG: SpoIVB peptidase [Blautia sp.]|nr:SpoIVB peptidase [Blautia sp.]